MCAGDEMLDFAFVVDEEGLDVFDVESCCALGLWEDEVGEGEQAQPAVEGNPVDNRCSISLDRVFP